MVGAHQKEMVHVTWPRPIQGYLSSAGYDSMQHDQIQGQGHEPFKVGNPPFLKVNSSASYNGSWQLTTNS